MTTYPQEAQMQYKMHLVA